MHMATAHGQAERAFTSVLLPLSSIGGQVLELLEPLLVLFVFLLNLVTDKPHVLASPDHRVLVRS